MNYPDTSDQAQILLVEDDDDHAYLTIEAFERANRVVNLHRVKDGVECMKFLRKESGYADVPTPDIIILDLNLPRKDGRDVLAEIISDERLKHLPVVVLTTSKQQEDIAAMYKLRASSYVIKPIDFAEYQSLINDLADYWLTMVHLPAIIPLTGDQRA